jgi:hypothetical protein
MIQTGTVLNNKPMPALSGGHKAGVLNSSFVAEVKSDNENKLFFAECCKGLSYVSIKW